MFLLRLRRRTRFIQPVSSPQTRSLQPLPSVDNQRDAVDVGCRVGREEQCGVLDIFDFSEPSERDPFRDLFFQSVRQQALHSLGVLDRSGSDAIYADAVTAPLN